MQGTHTKIHLAISQQQNTPTLYNFVTKILFCHYFLHSSAKHSLPFCAPATKLNIPVSEHFGKLQTPIGISSVRIR